MVVKTVVWMAVALVARLVNAMVALKVGLLGICLVAS